MVLHGKFQSYENAEKKFVSLVLQQKMMVTESNIVSSLKEMLAIHCRTLNSELFIQIPGLLRRHSKVGQGQTA